MKNKTKTVQITAAKLAGLTAHLRSSLQSESPGCHHDDDSAGAIKRWRAWRRHYVANNVAASKKLGLGLTLAYIRVCLRENDQDAATLERLIAA